MSLFKKVTLPHDRVLIGDDVADCDRTVTGEDASIADVFLDVVRDTLATDSARSMMNFMNVGIASVFARRAPRLARHALRKPKFKPSYGGGMRNARRRVNDRQHAESARVIPRGKVVRVGVSTTFPGFF